ncbi:unnamed protein product [Closterium sp. NIES-54]
MSFPSVHVATMFRFLSISCPPPVIPLATPSDDEFFDRVQSNRHRRQVRIALGGVKSAGEGASAAGGAGGATGEGGRKGAGGVVTAVDLLEERHGLLERLREVEGQVAEERRRREEASGEGVERVEGGGEGEGVGGAVAVDPLDAFMSAVTTKIGTFLVHSWLSSGCIHVAVVNSKIGVLLSWIKCTVIVWPDFAAEWAGGCAAGMVALVVLKWLWYPLDTSSPFLSPAPPFFAPLSSQPLHPLLNFYSSSLALSSPLLPPPPSVPCLSPTLLLSSSEMDKLGTLTREAARLSGELERVAALLQLADPSGEAEAKWAPRGEKGKKRQKETTILPAPAAPATAAATSAAAAAAVAALAASSAAPPPPLAAAGAAAAAPAPAAAPEEAGEPEKGGGKEVKWQEATGGRGSVLVSAAAQSSGAPVGTEEAADVGIQGREGNEGGVAAEVEVGKMEEKGRLEGRGEASKQEMAGRIVGGRKIDEKERVGGSKVDEKESVGGRKRGGGDVSDGESRSKRSIADGAASAGAGAAVASAAAGAGAGAGSSGGGGGGGGEGKRRRVLGPAKPKFLEEAAVEMEQGTEAWMPPQGQTGDGQTLLNKKLGY